MKVVMDELPDHVVEYIVKLRREAERYRLQRNGARAEVAALRAELDSLNARADG
jgi:hypothetical protein